MKPLRFFSALYIPLLLAACAPASKLQRPAAVPGTPTELSAAIDRVLQDSVLSQTKTGIKIVSLQTGQTFYERDSNLLFHPASNMKLFTTAAALKYLGPNFRFRTVLYADSASIQDSTIAGNIYLKGFADPTFSSEDLRTMVQQLHARGIGRITGNIVCDASYLDDLYQGAGWMWDDVSSWYWPPIRALVVNRNCVTVTVEPGKSVGDTLIYRISPPTAYMRFANEGTTVDSTDTLALKQFKVERKWRPRAENLITIQGGRAINAGAREFIIDVVNAPLYAGTLLAETLGREGVAFQGNIIEGALPDSATVLVQHQSGPLSEIILETNKPSDNLYAELLLKTVGAETRGTPGTAKDGLYVVKEMLAHMGVDTTKLQLKDGSGVSRYDVVTPAQIVALLEKMHADFRVQAEFKTSLPIAGVDGSLAHRMQNTPAEGLLRAKTGTLNGVSALSGYTTTADGEPLVFSIIMEHFVVPPARIRKIQDDIATLMTAFGRTRRLSTQVKR